MLKLEDVYTHPAVEAFGRALRFAVKPTKEDENLGVSADYSSLIELENAETPEAFAEVIKKFLRRYESNNVKKREAANKPVFKVSENDLKHLMGLVDRGNTRIVRAALISHALVRASKEE